MTADNLNKIRGTVRNLRPLIHSITNPISINQCANTVLCTGASPIMAEHPDEVAEITATAQALVLNLGNITDVRMKSMRISARAAKENNIPFVLDAVGIACSKLRRDYARTLIEESRPDVIKGNYSEIIALYNLAYSASGVDADGSLDENSVRGAAVKLAQRYGTVILASGKTDIVTDGQSLAVIKNGTPRLAQVTGTGCMLASLCGCYLSACRGIEAAVCACAVLGICGELSETAKGSGSFMVELMDKLSLLSDKEFEQYLKLEVTEIEAV